MTDTQGALPSWAVTDGRPDADKMIKYLYRYNYVTDKDGQTFVNKSLEEDYPAVYNLLLNYQMSTLVDKYTDMIDKGHFEAYRDDEGKLKYRMVDEVE